MSGFSECVSGLEKKSVKFGKAGDCAESGGESGGKFGSGQKFYTGEENFYDFSFVSPQAKYGTKTPNFPSMDAYEPRGLEMIREVSEDLDKISDVISGMARGCEFKQQIVRVDVGVRREAEEKIKDCRKARVSQKKSQTTQTVNKPQVTKRELNNVYFSKQTASFF